MTDNNNHDETDSDDDQPPGLEAQLDALDVSERAREIVLENWDSPDAVLEAGDSGLTSAGVGVVPTAKLIEGLEPVTDGGRPPDEQPAAEPAPSERERATSTPGVERREPGSSPRQNGQTNDQPDGQPAEPPHDSDPTENQSDSADTVDPRERNQESRAHRAGWALGRSVMLIPRGVATAGLGFLRGIIGIIPGRAKIYQKMIKGGYKNLYKKTDAHVVVDTVYADGDRVPRPAEIDKDENKLKTGNGEWWTVTTGLEKQFVGDVPVVTGVADQHETVDHIGARVAEAVDMGPTRHTKVNQQPNGFAPAASNGTNGAAGAMADGGDTLPGTTFDDVWLDVSNPDPTNDGWIVSLRKHYEMHFDRAGSEEMERQETRGILSAKEPNERSEWLKLLIFVGGLLLGLFGPALAGAISGGGGGGSPVPGGLGMLALLSLRGVWR